MLAGSTGRLRAYPANAQVPFSSLEEAQQALDGPVYAAQFDETYVGDTVVDDRALLHIGFEGTTTLTNDMEFSGMQVAQQSRLDVTGFVLWDVQRGVMFEQYRESAGRGEVNVPIAPVPIPITVRAVQRARLQQQ